MSELVSGSAPARSDARRNQQALLDAAAAVFVRAGVDAPVRAIAAEAGVGMGTVYRHFPTRADLVAAVYRHQVQECAQAGPRLLAELKSPRRALMAWIDLFVDFLVTKHGLAGALQSDRSTFEGLHQHFLTTLVPVGEELLDAARRAGELAADLDAYALMRGVGNLCAGDPDDVRYSPRQLVGILLAGLFVVDGT